LQKYFDYKPSDISAKCRICNEEIVRIKAKTEDLKDHLKDRHEQYFKWYDSAYQKRKFSRQQRKGGRGGKDEVENEDEEENEENEDEENEDDDEPNATHKQTMSMDNAEEVNLSK
jgi:hypothetical protein